MTSAALFTSIAMLIAGVARAEPSGDPFDGKLRQIDPESTMSSEEVAHYAQPYLPRVAACYKRHASPSSLATGELEIYLVITNTGKVAYSQVTTPKLAPVRRARLTRCLQRDIATWRFPVRTRFTNAVIPYFFLHTRAPASGPFPGCYDRKGCSEKVVPRTI